MNKEKNPDSTFVDDPEYMGSGALRQWLASLGLPSGTTWLAAAIKDGVLPEPIKIGNRNYWSREMRNTFLASLAQASAA